MIHIYHPDLRADNVLKSFSTDPNEEETLLIDLGQVSSR